MALIHQDPTVHIPSTLLRVLNSPAGPAPLVERYCTLASYCSTPLLPSSSRQIAKAAWHSAGSHTTAMMPSRVAAAMARIHFFGS